MTQAHPIPNVHARGSLAIECMTSSSVALLCTCERAYQIDLCAGIDHPADAAQNAIHFAEGSESIDVNGLQAGGLRKQFLVAHAHPRNCLAFGCLSYVGNLTWGQKNRALASSQIHARGMWSILHTASDYQSVFSNSSADPLNDECAPIADILPRCPAAIGASNSGAA